MNYLNGRLFVYFYSILEEDFFFRHETTQLTAPFALFICQLVIFLGRLAVFDLSEESLVVLLVVMEVVVVVWSTLMDDF